MNSIHQEFPHTQSLSPKMAFHSSHLSQDLSSLHHFAADQQPPQHHHQIPESTSPTAGTSSAPNWLNTALLRNHYTTATDFLNLQSSAAATDSPTSSSQWLPRHHNESACFLQRNHSDVIDDVAADSVLGSAGVDSSDLKVGADRQKGGVVSGFGEDGVNSSHKNGGGGGGGLMGDVIVGEGALDWRNARYKSEILSHPLYGQLLSAHVACLRIATPVDQLPRIDAQLAQSQQVVAKYSALAQDMVVGDDKELDQFMTHYVLLLCSFKEQLQQHVRVHAMEAVMACWEIEQSLQSLTGVSPGQSTGATMSDDEDDPVESDMNMFEGNFDSADTMGFGPLVPTESERSLMERVRQELKHELKQGYKEKIVDIREEILRKRRAGKLPGDTTSVLKAWWQSHSKWPYPTEEDKARLVQETGLQLKQINNWFINQRKRNWHSNASSSSTPSSTKSKRKK